MSHDAPLLMRRALPPPAGSAYRSPSIEKMIVLPSGLRSRSSHVPSSVLKRTVLPLAWAAFTSHLGSGAPAAVAPMQKVRQIASASGRRDDMGNSIQGTGRC